MRYLALASDYDGTLATQGKIDERTVRALEALRASGRRAILITGRVHGDLKGVLDRFDLFDRVVLENGAVMLDPATHRLRALGPAPSQLLVSELQRRGVGPIALGKVIASTRGVHETSVREAIRRLGLDLQLIFNKAAVMILPTGIDKASGLAVALGELGLHARNVIGVGDGENDHPMLSMCGCGVALANAVPMLQEAADVVLDAGNGDGVRALIEEVVATDFCGKKRKDLGGLDTTSPDS